MLDPKVSKNVDLRNIAKGLILGLSALYSVNYALERVEKRLDTQRDYFLDQFKEVKRETHEQIVRETDMLRADIRELRDHETQRRDR